MARNLLRHLHISTEFAFLLSGVFIMLVAWALNLMGVISGESDSGHGASDVYLWLFLMFQGLAFSMVGVVGLNYRELMVNTRLARRYLAAFLLIADGGLHLLAFNQHLVGSVFVAAFFAVVAPVQILGGITFPYQQPRFDVAWLLFTIFLIGTYLLTRTFPIWPIGAVEDIDPLGVISKLIEFLTVGVLISLMRSESKQRLSSPPASLTKTI